MAKGWQDNDIYSALQPVGNKRSTYTIEMEMALPKTEDRLGNPNHWPPKTTMPAGLPDELWERLILRRITSVSNTHNMLNEAQHCRSGQGCSAVPLHFQAVLETAQETRKCHRGMFRGETTQRRQHPISTYMDDLITPSATIELLQKKADTISKFCIICGIDIAKKKLRSYVANW